MLLLFLLAQAATPDPPPAPPAPAETLHKIVVDAIRNCPKAEPGEVVICSRDRGIAEGYRIPKLDPRYAKALRPSGRGELTGAAEGASGIGSCSKVGPGGAIGCTRDALKAWGNEQHRQRQADPVRSPAASAALDPAKDPQ